MIFNCFGAGKVAKAGVILGGAIVAGIAIVKRKKIGEFFSNLFNNKKAPNVDTPKPPKTNPISVNPPIGKPLTMTTDSLREEFGKLQKEDMPQFVSKVKQGTKEEQKSLLSVFTELDKKHSSMTDDLPEKLSLGKKLSMLKKEMKEQNLSFIPKLEITSGDSEKVIVDKIKKIETIMFSNKNEATLMEGLDWLEKNGQYGKDLNFSPYKNVYGTMIDEVTMPIRIDYNNPNAVTDKVLSRYIDIYNKYARKYSEYGHSHSDATNISMLFEEHAKNMSKETAFKFLDALEKTAVHKNQSYSFVSYADNLKIDKSSMEEFVKRAKALDDKLPKYGE